MFMLLFYKSRKIFTFLVFSPSSRTFEGQHSSEYNRNKTLALRLILSKRRKTINKTNKEENTYCNLTQGEQKEWGGALNAEKERVDNSENTVFQTRLQRLLAELNEPFTVLLLLSVSVLSLGLSVCFYVLVFINRVSHSSFKSWLALNSLHTWSWPWTPDPPTPPPWCVLPCPNFNAVRPSLHFKTCQILIVQREAWGFFTFNILALLTKTWLPGKGNLVTRWLTAHGTVIWC